MSIQYKVIDKALDIGPFTSIRDLCTFKGLNDDPVVEYTLSDYVSGTEKSPDDLELWYGVHALYNAHPGHNSVLSMYTQYIAPAIVDYLKTVDSLKTLLRMRVNFFPYTKEVYEHEPHTDHEFSCKAAILYLNTCDGFTRLEDGTKIDSIENRILLFDPSTPHNSTTTSNAKGRFNINCTYF